MFADPRVTAPMGIPHPNPHLDNLRAAKQERLSRADAGDWTVFAFDREDGGDEIFAGEVGIASLEPENRVFELFSAIDAGHGHKGYGREAVSMLMTHIFEFEELATIRMQTLITNERALALCRKLGYRETGGRYVEPDFGRGFVGGMAVILDCRIFEFRPFGQ